MELLEIAPDKWITRAKAREIHTFQIQRQNQSNGKTVCYTVWYLEILFKARGGQERSPSIKLFESGCRETTRTKSLFMMQEIGRFRAGESVVINWEQFL